MISIQITETSIYTPDLDQAEAFYSGILELTLIAKESERHLFYKLENGMLLIFNPDRTSKKPSNVDENPVPMHGTEGSGHVAFSVNDESYHQWQEKLKAFGVAIESEVEWSEGVRSFYFRDPAGNSLEIIAGDMWNFT